jgi:hypothetical protein
VVHRYYFSSINEAIDFSPGPKVWAKFNGILLDFHCFFSRVYALAVGSLKELIEYMGRFVVLLGVLVFPSLI